MSYELPQTDVSNAPTDRLALGLYWSCWAALVAMPFLLIGLSTTGHFSAPAFQARLPHLELQNGLSDWQVVLTSAMGVVPWLCAAVALFEVQRLMVLYRRGAALSFQAADSLRRLGATLLVLAVLLVVVETAQILVLTAAHPPGERVLSLSFGAPEIGFLFAASLLTRVGRAMTQAAVQARDLEAIV